MARTFDGTNDGLEVVQWRPTDWPVTIGCWYYMSSDDGTRMNTIGSCYSVAANQHQISLQMRADQPQNDHSMTVRDASGTATWNGTAFTTGSWQHFAIRIYETNRFQAFLNGSAISGERVQNEDLPSSDRVCLGHRNNGGSNDGFMNGYLAEAFIYGSDLGAPGIASLAKGFSPLLVDRGNLLNYWPLIDGLEDRGPFGDDLSEISGSATSKTEDHPGIIYPTSPIIIIPGSGGGGGITGTGAIELEGVEVTSSGTTTVTGTGAIGTEGVEVSGAGTTTVTGTSSVETEGIEVNGSGTVGSGVTGTGVVGLEGIQVVGVGTTASTGSGSVALEGVAVAGIGTTTVVGTGAIGLEGIQVVGGSVFVPGKAVEMRGTTDDSVSLLGTVDQSTSFDGTVNQSATFKGTV